MEGLTGYVYRNAHKTFFNNIDKYFAPFIVATQSDSFKARELNDILPENNRGLALVPQLLTNSAKDFIHTSKKIRLLGYDEINLNLGCPSGTVVSKNRGSGFLSKREELDAFLDEIFAQSTMKISVKTRIGKDSPDEFYELIDIFNKYPIEDLIIHPRIRKDFYKNKPYLKIFEDALKLSKNHVSYNGDIFTLSAYKEFIESFPGVDTIMLGRGLITNPALIGQIKTDNGLDKNVFKEFHDKILEGYKSILFGERNVLFKMKELWTYMIMMFTDNSKYLKRIKKSEKLCDYNEAVDSLFREQTILPDADRDSI